MVAEPQLNGRIATVIRESITGTHWTVIEETTGTLSGNQRTPDILITRPLPEPPIIIENEYVLGNVEGDCLLKLGQTLRPEHGGQKIHTIIGLYTPQVLQDAANGDVAEDMLRKGEALQYVAYTRTPTDYTRFPIAGFISGNVRNLVEFMKPAAEPADLIR